jgi:hypothetical protein
MLAPQQRFPDAVVCRVEENLIVKDHEGKSLAYVCVLFTRGHNGQIPSRL